MRGERSRYFGGNAKALLGHRPMANWQIDFFIAAHMDDVALEDAWRSQASDDARGVDYHKARAVRETYSARLAKLEFEERTGKLISKDEVDIKYFQLARQLRDRMQQIPRKVAPEIVALVVADPDVRGVTDILDVAIREALEDLAR